MENLSNFEERERQIDGLINSLAEREEMQPDDIFSDIVSFFEIYEEDDDARAYFEELAERVGISVEEMMDYAAKKVEEYTEE